jgi:hypothetical protein
MENKREREVKQSISLKSQRKKKDVGWWIA